MNKIGTVESVWRYPLKSMRGEAVDDVFDVRVGCEARVDANPCLT